MPDAGPADSGRIVLHDRLAEGPSPFRLAEDARRGLATRPRTMPPKYFYDARGSRLFEEITRLPEYYPTRAEREILERRAAEIVRTRRPGVLVEFGSGSAAKTRALLDAMRDAGTLEGYAPVEVSADASRRAAEALVEEYPGLRVEGVIGDFERPHSLPFPGSRRLFAFLGSTIGNFEPEAAVSFLRAAAGEMTAEDAFLVGFDLVKDPETLIRAYDDAAGVTAAFNRNLLYVMNRELGADFVPEAFAHRAVWNGKRARIEMHLVASSPQVVRLSAIDLEIRFEAGEGIRTELSHKYTRASAEALLAEAGLDLDAWWTDGAGRFALGLALTT